MPKPMMIKLFVEAAFVGPTLQRLHTMPGVASFGVEMDDAPAISKRGSKAAGTSARCLVLAALVKTPRLTRAQLVPIMEGNGKKANTLAGLLHSMQQHKQIKKRNMKQGVVYEIRPIGRKYLETSCNLGEE